jgi:deazaflavin-dependent oxidoreductase (nitroreductase family)
VTPLLSPDRTRKLVTPFQRHIANPIGRRVGRLMNSQAVLETIGRKSGLPRPTPIGGRRVGSSYWLVSEFGRKSQYVQNILVNPNVRLQIRGIWHTGTAVVVDDDDPKDRLRQLPWLNSALVRLVGSELLTIRVDLD